MNNLHDLIENYKKTPDLETQQAISKFYIKNKDNRIQIQEQLLNFIKQDNLKGGLEWYSFFEGDKKFWNKVFLVIEEKNAQKFLTYVKEHKAKTNEVYLDFAIDMCEAASSGVRDIKNMPQEVEKVWIEVFKEYVQFPIQLENSKKEKQIRLENYIKSLNIPVEKEPVTIKTLEMVVPIISIEGKKFDVKELENSPEYNEFMQDRVEFFNNFHLQGYIKHKQCHSITMKVENHENIFTLEINSEVNIDELRKELLGQLTDGLGSNLAQQPLLINNKMYYFDFDTKNASDLFEVKSQLTNKRKI